MTPDIFTFQDYRQYLQRCLQYWKTEHATSARAFARSCGITSPNYLQQVIRGERNLTPLIAGRIAVAMQLEPLSLDYLLLLMKLSTQTRPRAIAQTHQAMAQLVAKRLRRNVSDSALRAHWVNPIIWELLKTKHSSADAGKLQSQVRTSITVADIERALASFVQSGLLVLPAGGPPQPQQVDFKPSNDVRRIDLQQSHQRFLQLALQRLHDPLSEREFQGLTAAIKKESYAAIRDKCRELVHFINDHLTADQEADDVVRLQICLFKLTGSVGNQPRDADAK